MRKLNYMLALAVLLAFAAAPAPAQPITDDYYVTINPDGSLGGGGGSGYNDGEWYSYPETGPETEWWNEWFYDHPYDPDRVKTIHIEFELIESAVNSSLGGVLSFAVNWSTPEWSLEGNPPGEPRVPPLPGIDEDLYIGREVLIFNHAWPGPGRSGSRTPYVFDYQLPDYNPEWVSVAVMGGNFEIVDGIITHECRLSAIPTVSEWGLIVMALLVVTAGAIVFRKARKTAA